MRSIRVFDDIQKRDAREQAASMRGSDQPFMECIEFGKAWSEGGSYMRAVRRYELAKQYRELEKQSIQEAEELEKSA